MGTELPSLEVKGFDAADALGRRYAARLRDSGQDVWLRLLYEDDRTGDDSAFSARNRSLANIVQKNLDRTLLFGHTAVGTRYVVTEHVLGRTLAEAIGQSGTVQPGPAVEICAQIAWALCAIHEAGLSHGAVEPSRVLLTVSGGSVVTKLTGGWLPTAAGPTADIIALGRLLRSILGVTAGPPSTAVVPLLELADRFEGRKGHPRTSKEALLDLSGLLAGPTIEVAASRTSTPQTQRPEVSDALGRTLLEYLDPDVAAQLKAVRARLKASRPT
ncbi:MAG: hypothetical protein HYV07_21795 [Deltaproteobacteria bacterium]|nr:hypothetical protein [Deltaproteobacteria bacterium]